MRPLPGSWTARPARVAIAVPADDVAGARSDDWRRLVRDAWLHTTSFWGGAGAVVLPVGRDGVHDQILRTLCAYDPDYIVPYGLPPVDGRIQHEWLPEAATRQLSRHTSAIGPWDEHRGPLFAGRDSDPDYPLTPTSSLPTYVKPATTKISSDDPDLLLMAAAHHGWDRANKTSDVSISESHARQLLARPSWLSEGRRPTPLEAARQGADWLVAGLRRPDPAILVAGSSLVDHCLAMLIDRLFGPGTAFWLPVSDPVDATPAAAVGMAAQWAGSQERHRSGPLLVTSLTVDDEALEELSRKLSGVQSDVIINDRVEPHLKTAPKVQTAPSLPLDGPRAQLVDGHRLHLPVQVMVDDDGAATRPYPVPPIPRVAEEGSHRNIRWVVDLELDGVATPPRYVFNYEAGRAFGPLVRPGQGGWSWEAVEGFIGGADVAPLHHLNAVAITEPDLRHIVAGLAVDGGLRIAESNLSSFYNLTVDMWGGVAPLAADLLDESRCRALQLLQGAEPAKRTCKNIPRPALRLAELRSMLSYTLSVTQMRELIQAWVGAGILRRGFALKCTACRFAAFYPLESVGSSWSCERCRTLQDMNAGWPIAQAEPPFVYTLNELAGQALDHHIEVPILALQRAQQASRRGFRYALGLEVRTEEGNVVTDLDFVYLTGHELVVGEAKSNATLQRLELSTLLEVCETLTVDRLELVTSRQEWDTSTREAISAASPRWRPELASLQHDELLGSSGQSNVPSP